MIGVMTLDEALSLAEEQEKDVVLISPDANPPVCRLIDVSKFKYEQEKAVKDAARKQRENRCVSGLSSAAAPGLTLILLSLALRVSDACKALCPKSAASMTPGWRSRS